MKEYQKPVLEVISFASEAITTSDDSIISGSIGVGSGHPEWAD